MSTHQVDFFITVLEEREDYESYFTENNMFYKKLSECLVDFTWWLHWLGGLGGDSGSRHGPLVARLTTCTHSASPH